jgi:hypothetical protein
MNQCPNNGGGRPDPRFQKAALRRLCIDLTFAVKHFSRTGVPTTILANQLPFVRLPADQSANQISRGR